MKFRAVLLRLYITVVYQGKELALTLFFEMPIGQSCYQFSLHHLTFVFLLLFFFLFYITLKWNVGATTLVQLRRKYEFKLQLYNKNFIFIKSMPHGQAVHMVQLIGYTFIWLLSNLNLILWMYLITVLMA